MVQSKQNQDSIFYVIQQNSTIYAQLRNVDVCQANKHEEDLHDQRSAELIFNPAVTPLRQEESFEN